MTEGLSQVFVYLLLLYGISIPSVAAKILMMSVSLLGLWATWNRVGKVVFYIIAGFIVFQIIGLLPEIGI